MKKKIVIIIVIVVIAIFGVLFLAMGGARTDVYLKNYEVS